MESYEIKCTSCSLLLGESATAVENIVCVFCIDERNYLRAVFSGDIGSLTLGTEYEEYMARYKRYKTWREMPHYFLKERIDGHRELQTFISELKWKCDMKETKE